MTAAADSYLAPVPADKTSLDGLCRALFGLFALIPVVEVVRNRVMGIVHLGDQIGDGQLQLMGPKTPRLARRRQSVPAAEEEQDVGGLADHQLAGLEEGRCERRFMEPPAVHQAQHAVQVASRHIDVVRTRFLQGQANEFATPLDRRPVMKLVSHDGTLMVASAGGASLPGYSFQHEFNGEVASAKRRIANPGASSPRNITKMDYSGSVSPDPPISLGRSFILGSPSRIATTFSA